MKLFLTYIAISWAFVANAQCYTGQLTGDYVKTKFSGNASFDQAINREYAFLTQKFGVMPDMYFFYDGNNPNAYASSQISNPNLPDGTVSIGFSLINSECSLSYSNTCSALGIIMGHEFAHIVANKYRLNLQGKYNELFADFMAGCYMHLRGLQFTQTAIDEAARSFYGKGDTNFFSPIHHGTPQERYNALMAGYNFSFNCVASGYSYNLNDAVTAGTNYLKH